MDINDRNPDIKVGDYVIVIYIPTQEEKERWHDSWLPNMNGALNKIFKVKTIRDYEVFLIPIYSKEDVMLRAWYPYKCVAKCSTTTGINQS